MIVTLNVAVLLAIIIIWRIRRHVEARSRADQWLTVTIVLVFGLLIAQTGLGQGILKVVGQITQSITQAVT
ncbi:hypothetical protein [Streptomyces sp. MST-110588]|uniref:hypothetical protein n=1 Tax=Streptomyces sp. MST-110588 TaxID=2833628 RepID=UPI001F5C6EA2|nr:hypothetical protein [Streptomyces sp. MST-110588]UNO40744.1 hypothetical protein KGS77_15655 [Streptomyces sp. MST-110588]